MTILAKEPKKSANLTKSAPFGLVPVQKNANAAENYGSDNEVVDTLRVQIVVLFMVILSVSTGRSDPPSDSRHETRFSKRKID
jgi:hypothetical protein